MYKVFLADDNELSRRSVKDSVSWKKSGCKIVGESRNGMEAYEKILELKPDIALLDIKMPGLSGLEIAKKLKESKLNCLIILVTAYDDFSFAREGLKLGVFDYLLKPVAEEELREVIVKAIQQLKEQGSQTEEFVSRELMNKALLGSAEAAQKLQTELQKKWRFKEYCLILVSADKNISEIQSKDLIAACEKLVHVHLLDEWVSEGLVLLCLFQDVQINRDYNLTALKAGNYISKFLGKQVGNVIVSISETSKKTDDFPKLFKHTIFSKNSRFFLENQNVIHYESLHSQSIQNEYKMMEYLDHFLSDCRSGSEKMLESLDVFLRQLIQDKSYDAEYVQNILIQTGLMMSYSVRQRDPGAYTKSVNDLMRDLKNCSTIQEASSWLKSYARELCGTAVQEQNYSIQTRRILDYLNENYREHIALQDASEALKLSSAHICRLLKNDTGETFVTLLNKIRIQEAIRLLKEGELKVYEVADQVGFSNYAYFYQLFKKETGCSPSEFK